jgi:hypothetical protein
MFTLGGITLFVFILRFVLFTFQESPKYLLMKGKDSEALKVLHTVAKTNKVSCDITLDTFAALTREGLSESSTEDPDARILEDQPDIKKAGGTIWQKFAFELKRCRILFSTPTLARITILVWITYAFDYWGFSIAGNV